jgi:chromosome segregation ATPase
MPSPHSINFPDDPDPLARYRREAEQQEEEFARQRAHAERVQQSKVQTMEIQSLSPDVQARWDAWLDARVETRVVRLRDAVADAVGEFQKQNENADAALRREIRQVRDAPPLFSAPDKKLSAAMVRVGEELRAQKEGIEALRAGEAKREARTKHTADQVAELRKQLAELAEQNELTAKNVRGLNTMMFNLSTKLERMHELLARFAAAADCEHALNAVDRSKLPQAEEQQKSSAVVLKLEDLRHAS